MDAHQNPFAVQRVHRLPFRFSAAETADGEIFGSEQLASQFIALARFRRRACLLGPHGQGKSTLLREVGQRLEAHRLQVIFLTTASDNPQPVKRRYYFRSPVATELRVRLSQQSCDQIRRTVILLDSGENLQAVAWWEFLSAVGDASVLTTLHQPPDRFAWLTRQPVSVLYRCHTSAAQFMAMCHFLLQDQPAVLRLIFSDEVLLNVYQKHAGNIRNCFFELYDRCTELKIN